MTVERSYQREMRLHFQHIQRSQEAERPKVTFAMRAMQERLVRVDLLN